MINQGENGHELLPPVPKTARTNELNGSGRGRKRDKREGTFSPGTKGPYALPRGP